MPQVSLNPNLCFPCQVCLAINLFADDAKLTKLIVNVSCHHKLQNDLDKLYKLNQYLKIKFNAKNMFWRWDKCKLKWKYKTGDEKINTVEEEKDLGIIQNYLSSEKHIR